MLVLILEIYHSLASLHGITNISSNVIPEKLILIRERTPGQVQWPALVQASPWAYVRAPGKSGRHQTLPCSSRGLEEGSFPYQRHPGHTSSTQFISMAEVRNTVDWKDKRKIWARIPSAKSTVTRACTAIDKLIDREYTFDTLAASQDTRGRLLEAFDFCVKLHDRWSNLDILDGNDSASETAKQSIKTYEEKQFASLARLDKYIAENAKAQTSTPVAETPDQTSTLPKLCHVQASVS